MTIHLRHYQVNAIHNLRHLIGRKGYKRILLQASTGAGKTVIAAEIIRSASAKGNKCLFVAHRREIINQTSGKLKEVGIKHGIIMSSVPHELNHHTYVASIQTLSRRYKPPADILILDECHLSMAKSFLDLIAEYPNAIVLGLTATPVRLDGRGLGKIYQVIESVIPMRTLIEQGHLCQYKVFAVNNPDLTGIKTVMGDYDKEQANSLMDNPTVTLNVVDNWLSHARGMKTIVFASSVRHSEHIRDQFIESGISAKHLDGKTDDTTRARILKEFADDKFTVLCNYGLFVEGFDQPDIACVVLARITKSIAVYLQSVGRGMRPHPSKTHLVILDCAGRTYELGFVDDDREWTLEDAKKKKKGESENIPKMKTCPECGVILKNNVAYDNCPECGFEFGVLVNEDLLEDDNKKLIEITREQVAKAKAEQAAILQKQKEEAISKRELKAAKTREQLIELGRKRNYHYPESFADKVLATRASWTTKERGVQ